MKRYTVLFLLLLCACTAPQGGGASRGDAQPQAMLVDRIWVSTESSAAPGTLLRDGALLMDSCTGTYRIAKWRPIDARRIEWTEDSARIGAEITELTSDSLRLRLQLRSEVIEHSYRPAQVPTVCPDMPR
jgi:hypothetical protein